MPAIDIHAAQRLRDLRVERGLSPEALAQEIAAASRKAGWGERGAVNAHTLRRIEGQGHIPGPRVAFVVAAYFGLKPTELWDPGNRRAPARVRVAA